MRPETTMDHVVGRTGAHAELFRERTPGSSGCCELSHLKHARSGQRGPWVFVATAYGAMRSLVEVVISYGVPTQIAQVVIAGIAVIVAALHPVWAWSNEHGQQQSVQAELTHPFVLAKTDVEVVLALHRNGFNGSPFVAKMQPHLVGDETRPERAVRADGVSGAVWHVRKAHAMQSWEWRHNNNFTMRTGLRRGYTPSWEDA